MKLLPMVLLFLATSAYGEIYTWTDARGADHYANRPDEIPVRHRARARALNYGAEPEAGAGSVYQVQATKPLVQRETTGPGGNPANQFSAAPPEDSRSKNMRQQRVEQRERMHRKNPRNRQREE
jgi:Domain of unknown function (DUF4124)